MKSVRAQIPDGLLQPKPQSSGYRIDVKFNVDALRAVRTGLLQLAYSMAETPVSFGYLVLVNSKITRDRLGQEWRAAAAVFRPDVFDRIAICVIREDRRFGVPRDPDAATWQAMEEAVREQRSAGEEDRKGRLDYFAVILEILLCRWLTDRPPIGALALARSAGCSYPTVSRAVQRFGSLLERSSGRRISLRSFPHDDFAWLLAVSPRFRRTARFADRSGQPRSPESLLSRLRQLRSADIALGGSLGARHYCSGLNLLGTPRLDLSLHKASGEMDLGFIAQLDPALKQVEDPSEPASVAVHAVRRSDSLFEPDAKDGLPWADPVECLLDLHETGLESQAREFLAMLIGRRQRQHP
jgi:CRP-like cAMP-binding protein